MYDLRWFEICESASLQYELTRRMMSKAMYGNAMTVEEYHDDSDDGELEALGIKPTPERLVEHGICDMGLIPRYYNFLEKLDVERWGRNLAAFSKDKHPPNAIFIEHIPNMKPPDLELYSASRMSAFIHGLQLIHAVLVLHRDVRPRNMMIVTEPHDRVIWMEVRTYDSDRLTVKDKLLFGGN